MLKNLILLVITNKMIQVRFQVKFLFRQENKVSKFYIHVVVVRMLFLKDGILVLYLFCILVLYVFQSG
jgi:hypothetical protein